MGAVIWQLYVVDAYLSYNKVPSKILYFGHSLDIINQNKGTCPYMRISILPITL